MVQFLICREKDPFDDVFFPKLVTFNSSHKLKHFCILGKFKKNDLFFFRHFPASSSSKEKETKKEKG